MTRIKQCALLAGIVAAAVTPSAAYYHYVHYLSLSPFQIAYEKFDLTALPDKTVTFFVSSTGPSTYTSGDSFPSVLEQIRNATRVWDAVASSDLRVGFGGLQIAGTAQNAPAGEVVFDDQLPPGVLAFAGPASTGNVTTAADGTQFVPITESIIYLNSNMTQQPGPAYADSFAGPSYSESFFTILVHEIGHAIGLQHTYTAASMSTAVSRATNRARPLDADDIAAISLLYPRGGFPAGFGSISGQVTMGGQGVHMASVVAIQPNGSAISSLTNPDGTYEIDGLPPGNYFVYVHPLPLDTANIMFPIGPDGQTAVAPSGPFVSTFYDGANGTWDPNQFASIPIAQGASASGINFSVQPRAAVEVSDVTSYWYPAYQYPAAAPGYLQPAYLNANLANTVPQVIAQGNGIASGSNSTNVQSVFALGGAPNGWLADYGTSAYVDGPDTLLATFFSYPAAPATGPEHLLFTLPDDIFVLPQAIQVVQNPPPGLTAVTPNPDGSVTVTGTGLTANSQVYFDSLPGLLPTYAAVQSDETGQTGTVSVMPPPGASGQTSAITVYNPDGQNSTFLQSQNSFTYSYAQGSAPAAAISISQLPQGVSAMVMVTSSNMQFVDGMTTLGFGSGDIAVRHLWVLPSKNGVSQAIANVTVSPSAIEQETMASVIAGFQVYPQSLGFQVLPANAKLPLIGLPVMNAFYPLQNSLYPGAIASLYGQNLLSAKGGTPTMTVGGGNSVAQVLYASATQINFVIPAGVNPGPQVMTFQNGSTEAYPLVLEIDPPPPILVSAQSAAGTAFGAADAAAPGDTITLIVSGMLDGQGSAPVLSRVGVTEGGVSIPVFTVQPATDGSNDVLIQFALTATVTGQQIPVTVSLDGDLSMPYYINIAVPAASTSGLRVGTR